jgi:hypothetical protein
MGQETQELGQFTESPGVAFLFLEFQDVIDLLDAQQTHAERQHANRVARVGPLAGFRQLLFGELKPRSEKIDKRCDLDCEHRIASEKDSDDFVGPAIRLIPCLTRT